MEQWESVQRNRIVLLFPMGRVNFRYPTSTLFSIQYKSTEHLEACVLRTLFTHKDSPCIKCERTWQLFYIIDI